MNTVNSKVWRFIGQVIGNRVLIAKQLCRSELDKKFEEFEQNHSVTINRQLIPAPRNAILDTIEFGLSHQVKNPSYVVFMWGRSCAYENHLAFMAKVITDLQINGLSFNFRGVGHSSGELYSENDLIQDGYFQVMRLINHGVEPKKITVYGHSLGGAVAARVVSLLHEQGFPVLLFCDRTFSSLVDATVSRYLNKFTLIPSRFFEKLIRWFMQYGWELHVVPAYEKIPSKYKRHTVIQGEDLSIPYAVSLHHHLSLQNESDVKYGVMTPCPNAHMAYLEHLLPMPETTYSNALESLYGLIRQN